MNTTLSTAPRRREHPPHLAIVSQPVRRVGLLDRLALHIGIALIAWGRRPYAVDTRERRANRIEQELARLERECAAEKALRLMR